MVMHQFTLPPRRQSLRIEIEALDFRRWALTGRGGRVLAKSQP